MTRYLTAGDPFGELALFDGSQHKRTVSVIARNDVTAATLTAATFLKFADKTVFQKAVFLQHVDLFRKYDIHSLSKFAASLTQKIVPRKKAILSEGVTSDHLYFVKSGKVCFTTPAEVDETDIVAMSSPKEDIILSSLDTRGYFGESGILHFLTGESFTEHANAVAATELEIYVLEPADYKLAAAYIDPEVLLALHQNRRSWRRRPPPTVMKEESTKHRKAREKLSPHLSPVPSTKEQRTDMKGAAESPGTSPRKLPATLPTLPDRTERQSRTSLLLEERQIDLAEDCQSTGSQDSEWSTEWRSALSDSSVDHIPVPPEPGSSPKNSTIPSVRPEVGMDRVAAESPGSDIRRSPSSRAQTPGSPGKELWTPARVLSTPGVRVVDTRRSRDEDFVDISTVGNAEIATYQEKGHQFDGLQYVVKFTGKPQEFVSRCSPRIKDKKSMSPVRKEFLFG